MLAKGYCVKKEPTRQGLLQAHKISVIYLKCPGPDPGLVISTRYTY